MNLSHQCNDLFCSQCSPKIAQKIIDKRPDFSHLRGVPNIVYQLVNDTAYHLETPRKLIEILEALRLTRERVIITYGDLKIKRPSDYQERGRIGRSGGKYKVPLLIKTVRSMGGGEILDHLIYSVQKASNKEYLYKV